MRAAMSMNAQGDARLPTLLPSQRAFAELAAELIGDAVAARLPLTVQTYEAAQIPGRDGETRGPVQQLIYAPNGGGTVDSVYVVPGGAALWPLSVMCRLRTNATVADRTVALEYRTGDGDRYLVAGTQAVVQANGNQSFCWHPQAGEVAWPIEDAAIAPLPQQHVYPGHAVALKVWGGDAGDVLDQVRISARYDPLAV